MLPPGRSQQLAHARQEAADAKATVAQWNARLDRDGIGATLMMRRDFKKLGEKVDGLAQTLAGELDTGKLNNPAAPRWDNLDQEQQAAQLAQLRAWVDGVLLRQYPEYPLPGCWHAHRAALWELGNLYAEWLRIYAGPLGADLEAALWFHERWLPGTIGRLNPGDQHRRRIRLPPPHCRSPPLLTLCLQRRFEGVDHLLLCR